MRRFFREACVVVLFVAFSACDQQGCAGCAGCGIEQIPGGFPLENRIPNAGQMRLTTHGIDFIEANMAQIVSQFLPDGLSFPVPQSQMDFAGFNAEVCPHGDCFVDLELTDVSLDPRGPNALAVALRMIVSTRNLSLGVDLGFDCPNCEWNGFGWDCSSSTMLECTVGVDTRWENPEDVGVTVDIVFTTDPHTGYTQVVVEDPQLSDDLTGGDFDIGAAGGCFLDGVCDIGNIGFLKDLLVPLIADQLGSQLAGPLQDQLCRQCEDVGACPNGNAVASSCNDSTCIYDDDGSCVPLLLGTEGRADLGTLLQTITPGLTGRMQFAFASGGDGEADTGLNLNFMGGLDSLEHNRCVPLRPVPERPDIPTSTALRRNETPGGSESMVNIGISEDYMNWASYGVYDSGMLCIAAGPRLSQSLSTGLFSLLFPSIKDVVFPAESAPVALQLRPQYPPFIDIGAGTEDDPILEVTLDDLMMDFYALTEDRYVRLMTVQVDMSIGINLQMEPEGILPVIDEPSVTNVVVTNSDLLTESPDTIAEAFGDIVGMAMGQFLGSLQPIAVPDLMGFALDIPADGITRVTELDSDFLAIFANLAFAANQASRPIEADTSARLDGTDVDPTVYDLVGNWRERLPVAHLTFDADIPGRADAEWSYRVDEGTWSRWSRERVVAVRSKMFLLQGRHTIEVRSRVAGQVLSGDRTPATVELTIDTRAPRLDLALADGVVVATGTDIVDEPAALAYSVRRPGGSWSAWGPETRFVHASALEVRVRDSAGNVAERGIDGAGIIRGRPSNTATGACECNLATGAGRGATGGPLAILGALLIGVTLVRRRRLPRLGRALRILGVVLPFALLAGGCDCAGGTNDDDAVDAGPSCPEECAEDAECCESTGECVTQPDYGCDPGYECDSESGWDAETCTWAAECNCVPLPPIETGFVGSYTDFAQDADGTIWVSGYSEGVPRRDSYGDLVVGTWADDRVDWVIVDGLPAGGEITGDPTGWRGGTAEPGDDVGKYTSLALGPDDSPRIAYYDVTNGDLKLALSDDGTWVTSVVDDEGDAGRYAAIVSLGADLHPLIMYWATVPDPEAPGRFVSRAMAAEGDGPYPESWSFSILHEIAVPCRPWLCGEDEECAEAGHCFAPVGCEPECGGGEACDGGTCVAVLPSSYLEEWPEGTGLFASVAIDPDGNPGAVFYDRTNGDVYRAWSDGETWTAELLDGFDHEMDTGDVGQSATLAIDGDGTWHVAYVNGWSEALVYRNLTTHDVEVADDGYRDEGLHFVGDDANIAVAGDGTVTIVYQDATAGTLERATRAEDGSWSHETLDGGGDGQGFTGFFAKQFADHVGCYYRDYEGADPMDGVRVF